MPTPTDPYSSAARRPFDEDEILAPISPEVPSSPASGYSSISAASAEESPRGSNPAFDTNPPASPEEAGPSSLADALAHQSGPEAETPDKPEPEPAPDLFAEPPVVETATGEIPTGTRDPRCSGRTRLDSYRSSYCHATACTDGLVPSIRR